MANLETEKANAALAAVDQVASGMLVGLGSGSTAAYAVKELGRRVTAGLTIRAVATSRQTQALAESVGITVITFDGIDSLDLTIDGADEISPVLQAIKGGGGALLREKVVATASTRVIAIVDSSKPVQSLGRFRLPVEVLPFAAGYVLSRLSGFGVPVTQRMTSGGEPFLTDQGAFIFDVAFGNIPDPESIATEIDGIPGILEHGLFLTEIHTAFIGRGMAVDVVNKTN